MTLIVGQSPLNGWRNIQKSEPTDIYIHLASFPGPSVIIRGEDPDYDRIMEAAIVCKDNSKYKFKGIKVNYTPISNIVLGEIVGTVRFIDIEKVESIIP